MARFEIDDVMAAPVTEGGNPVAVAPLQIWQRPTPLAAGILALLVITGVGVWRSHLRRFLSGHADALVAIPGQPYPVGTNALNLVLSQDGRWLAFTGGGALGRDGQLYLRNLAEGAARPISGTVGAAFPFFSPDGQWVGFFDFAEGQLKKVSVTGGTPNHACVLRLGHGAGAGAKTG